MDGPRAHWNIPADHRQGFKIRPCTGRRRPGPRGTHRDTTGPNQHV
ncbi:hypothetical protein [Kibdelosporangium philippinense]